MQSQRTGLDTLRRPAINTFGPIKRNAACKHDIFSAVLGGKLLYTCSPWTEFLVLYPDQGSKFQSGWITRRKFKRTKFLKGARMHFRGAVRVFIFQPQKVPS